MAGRRRDPALDAAIRAAATELLHERGWGGFTVEEVAVRVGVPKSTVYKRWSSRVHLASAILDAWLGGVIGQAEVALAAPPEDRLQMLIQVQTAFTAGPEGRAVTEVLVSDADEPSVTDLRLRVGVYRELCHQIVGSVASDLGTPSSVDVSLIADMLLGAIWLRSMRGFVVDGVKSESLLRAVQQLLHVDADR
jgi:AcrR family transcriptional regulator